MTRTEYEREFESIICQLRSTRQAYEVAEPDIRALRLAELTELKDRLLKLSATPKKFDASSFYIAALPENEPARLKALQDLKVLDSSYEEVFDSITSLASRLCGTPMALISLLDEHRQWFKANVGLPGLTETPRELAFCSHTILNGTLMEIPDASLDIRFAEHPGVKGEPGVRFYAGAPIILPLGEKIGTLCVLDKKSHQLTEFQKEALRGLAEVASKALVARSVTLENLDG